MMPRNGPTPPSSHSSNGPSPDGAPFRVVRKRNRIPLSCGPCRHRKLKCNRGSPCDNCSKRGDAASCNYANAQSRRKNTNGGTGPDEMQNRIDRLEGLVLSLMTAGGQQQGGGAGAAAAAQVAINGSRSNSTTNSMGGASELRLYRGEDDMIKEEGEMPDESDVDQVSRGIGIMKMDNGRALFASDAHWYAILGEISEVKNYFNAHKEDYVSQVAKVAATTNDGDSKGTILLRAPLAKDKSEILAQFPAKADSDRLIARYFNAYDPSVHIIHGPTFQSQYDQHWTNPEETSVAWLGLCFAMMTLALQSYTRAGDEPPEYQGRALELSNTFRRLTAQCLILADITQPLPHALETLILHIMAEYGRSRDPDPGVLILVSLCVRQAMRMGYHRDPGPHPNVPPFQKEMRRRVWCFVRTCDLVISFQFGMPAMIRTDHIDTLPPRNLFDDELYEDMKALPPSRPTYEATPMSYMIAKARMTFAFGQIVERTQSVSNPPSHEETMAFDQELREVRAGHPPHIQMRSFQDSARDPANLIMQRYGLEMVFLRSLFVLHKRFIARGRDNPRFAYSRRTCIDASMELLAHQATLHREAQPGGRLRSVKWYISSLTTHDFLLAGMLVCLDLYHVAEAECYGRKPPTTEADDPSADERRASMMSAVEHSIAIWRTLQDHSVEAWKAATTLSVLVDKLKAHSAQRSMEQSAQQSQQPQQQDRNFQFSRQNQSQPFNSYTNSDFPAEDLAPEQSAAMTLGMLSSGGITSPGNSFTNMQQQQQAASNADKQGSYPPTNLAALLNDNPMGAERTGLTPGYSGSGGIDSSGAGAMSPFSQMFGSGTNAGGVAGGFSGLEGGGDIDWGAWDSYIQGPSPPNMDASASLWPLNFDFNNNNALVPPMAGQQVDPQLAAQQGQSSGGGNTGPPPNGGVANGGFVGANVGGSGDGGGNSGGGYVS
ncbi:hypothetical protein MBLNU230_g5716t1 [Neophaeotheca triangularis]